MPRILSAAEILKDPREEIHKIIASLKPGQSVVLMEVCEELGISTTLATRHIPKENKLIARVKGHHKPVILITCPESSTPQARTKRK